MDTPPFTYQHKIPSLSLPHRDENTPIPSFTATGRPFNPSTAKHGSGLGSLGSAESFSGGEYPNYLPRRYTDASLISIAVLPTPEPDTTGTFTNAFANTTPLSPSSTYSGDTLWADPATDPIQHQTKSSKKFWRRKPSTSSSPKFIMKSVTRGDYLKYYAKDEKGWYIGTEAPAPDCILRQGGDVLKWRKTDAEKAVETVEKGMSEGQKRAARQKRLLEAQLLANCPSMACGGG